MSIYIVHYFPSYDDDRIIGYFLEEDKANECKRYFDMQDPAFNSEIVRLEECEEDYTSRIQELIDADKRRWLAEEAAIREKEIAELARLKAKYESTVL